MKTKHRRSLVAEKHKKRGSLWCRVFLFVVVVSSIVYSVQQQAGPANKPVVITHLTAGFFRFSSLPKYIRGYLSLCIYILSAAMLYSFTTSKCWFVQEDCCFLSKQTRGQSCVITLVIVFKSVRDIFIYFFFAVFTYQTDREQEGKKGSLIEKRKAEDVGCHRPGDCVFFSAARVANTRYSKCCFSCTTGIQNASVELSFIETFVAARIETRLVSVGLLNRVTVELAAVRTLLEKWTE